MPIDFALVVKRGFDAVTRDLVGDFEQFVGDDEERGLALHLAGFGGEFFLRGDDEGDLRLGEVECFHKLLLGQFAGLAFDHDHVGFIADIHEIEVAELALAMAGVGDEFAIDPAHAHGTDRACERDVADAQRGARAIDEKDVGIMFAVRAEEDADDLRVVEVAFREKRTQRAVRHAAGEDFFFGRTAFAFEITAGEFADRSRFFAVIDGEREPVLAVLDGGGGDGGDHDDGIAAADCDGTVREAGELAGFDGDGSGSDVDRDIMDHIITCSSFFWLMPGNPISDSGS